MTPPDGSTVRIERAGPRRLRSTLCRPDAANALSRALVPDLRARWRRWRATADARRR